MTNNPNIIPKWYDAQNIEEFIQILLSNPEDVEISFDNKNLNQTQNLIEKFTSSNKKHLFLPLKIKVEDKNFLCENHWVSFHFKKDTNQNIICCYFDPIGMKISDEIKSFIPNDIKIYQPLKDTNSQYVEVISYKTFETIYIGQVNDSGPVLCYILSQSYLINMIFNLLFLRWEAMKFAPARRSLEKY